jgi:hypothetical protein
MPNDAQASADTLSAEMSESLPFLTNPKNTDGLIGSVGFDPLGFSDTWDIKWLQEAKIKHGRICMLATVDFITSQFVTLPMFTPVADSSDAPSVVGMAGMMQIVLFAGAEEWRTNKGRITMDTMFEDPERVPGGPGMCHRASRGQDRGGGQQAQTAGDQEGTPCHARQGIADARRTLFLVPAPWDFRQ